MFFPLKDHNPTERFPFVTIAIIVLNIAAFVYEISLGSNLVAFIRDWGATPYNITHGTIASVFPNETTTSPPMLTLFTSMFLHGGVMHILGNMLYLWIFGNNVEDLMGPVRFLVFYLACGLIAAGAHIAVNPSSTVPTVGASGAVAGVLGAYLVAYPRARVLTLVFIVIFVRLIELPAAFLLLFWFIVQSLQGFMSISSAQLSGGVAWFAHIGGFVAGLLGIHLLAAPRLRALKAARQWSDGTRSLR